jgi:hypothetical protein
MGEEEWEKITASQPSREETEERRVVDQGRIW